MGFALYSFRMNKRKGVLLKSWGTPRDLSFEITFTKVSDLN